MLETSKDFLNIAIGVAVVCVAGFSCWAIYYMARILQQVFKGIKDMRDRLTKLDEIIKSIKGSDPRIKGQKKEIKKPGIAGSLCF